jgi:hypothetical protein
MEADVVFTGHGARARWRSNDMAGKEVLNLITSVNSKNFSLTVRRSLRRT